MSAARDSYKGNVQKCGHFHLEVSVVRKLLVHPIRGMMNGALDLAGLGSGIASLRPYIDGGIGCTGNHRRNMNRTNFSLILGVTYVSIACGLGAGAAMPVTPDMAIDVSYKYLDLGELCGGTNDAANAISPFEPGLGANLVMAGLRLGF